MQDQQRRKHPPQHILKHIPSANTLFSNKERKKTQKSKENQTDKNQKITILNPRKTPPTHHQQTFKQYQNKKIANDINFRNLKSGLGKKTTKEIIRVINQPLNQQHQGISINVNIQNMISGKKNTKNNLSELNSERSSSLIKHDKSCEDDISTDKLKGKKKKTIDDFQCNEELQFPKNNTNNSMINTSSNINASNINTNKLQKKISQKKPLITYPNEKNAMIGNRCEMNSIIKPKILSLDEIKQQIKQFDNLQQLLNSEAQTQMIIRMDIRQQVYTVDPTYIQRRQKNLTWIMRGILLEWMMHVCSQFSLKRQTYHIALVLTDNYFAKVANIPKGDVQLVGATTMFIASKLEEFQPLSSKQFSKSTNQLYSNSQIKEMETQICKILKFNLNPPTINMWANRIMTQWDQYIELSQTSKNHPLFDNKIFLTKIFFKKADQNSYNNFRIVMQLIDCAMLDVQSLQYRPQFLVCSFIYLVLGKQLNEFKTQEIIEQFPRSSLYLLDESNLYNDLFRNFVHQSFGFLLMDLLPTVQYSATYFILPIIIDQPNLRAQSKGDEDINYQQYCSFQTYNANSLKALKKRHRDIYQ